MMTQKKNKLEKVVSITIVTDDNGDQCLYRGGIRWDNVGESTVFACDLEEAAGPNLIRLKTEALDHHFKDWPLALSECLIPPHS